MSRSLLLIATCVLGLTGLALADDRRGSQPNIIFILADDLGFADTGATGARALTTPSIDSLAAAGLTITNAYSSSPICSPTRTALLTGRYAQRYRLGLEEPLRSSDAKRFDLGIPKDHPTIASVLRDQGYETALVGKWHLGIPPRHSPLEHGYEHFFGIAQGAADYFLHTMVKDGEKTSLGLFDGNEQVERSGYMTDLLGDEAVRLIRGKSDRPLFLSLHFTAPHWPWEGRGDRSIANSLSLTQHYDGGSLETYAEMVEVMDENIGRVLAALDETGIADNSIVIFTSDKGGERFSDTWPFVGVKGEVLEGGIRVPLFVRWPARIAAGSQSDQVMTSMDFLPTLLAAGGGDVKDGAFDGINLLSQLLGDASPVERTIFWRFKAGEQGAVRQGDWKYVTLGGKEHLFNVASDPRERVKLQDEHAETFQELQALYERWNLSMLPYPEVSFSESVQKSYPDRY